MTAVAKTVCIDASVAIAAAVHADPDHAVALSFLKALDQQNTSVCAPALFRYECDSVIRLLVFRGALTDAEAATARTLIDALGVILEFDAADSSRAFEIATDYRQPRAYDAAYAAHAEARGIEFVTVDNPFFEAVNGANRPKAAKPLHSVKLLK